MRFEQKSFEGGLNLLDTDINVQQGQYRMLINGRQRYGEVRPNPSNVLQTGLPAGKYQGGIGVDNIALVFVNGLAYYQLDGQTGWTNIAEFLLSDDVPRVWSIAVPLSNYNYVRKLGDSLNEPMLIGTDFFVAGTPAGILVQDGINQPWIIQFNATTQTFFARETKKYADWSNSGAGTREYVPVGTQMMLLNQKLYIVAADKKSIYHSVTGRYLDFMVNVDTNGNKLAAEGLGGADSVSFNFDNDEITIIRAINYPDSFVYSTAKTVRIVTADYTRTLFGEPTYREAINIEAGIVNDQGLIEASGDYLFQDGEAVKSFNAVRNLKVEGRNSEFSAQLLRLFKGVKQSTTACIQYDNYGLFYCKTTLGNAILVYDMIRNVWCSVDITTTIKIKQFFIVSTTNKYRLFAVTDNALWEMYASTTESEACQAHFVALTTPDGKAEHKGQFFKPMFRGGTQTGTIRLIEYADEKLSSDLLKTLPASVMGIDYPVKAPIIPSNIPNTYGHTLIVNSGLVGKKLAYVLLWDTDAALQSVTVDTAEQDGDSASRQR